MKIYSLKVTAFRGLVDFTLEPKGKTVVLSGPNGSGKSSVLEAIDFLLAGNIRRFEGKGAGELTLAKHAVHLGHKLSESIVEATVVVDGRTFHLVRRISEPKKLDCKPSMTPALQAALDVAARGHHVLTRAQILKFISVTPGDRATAIQPLMRAERIQELATNLRTLARNAGRQTQEASEAVALQQKELAEQLGLDEFDPALVAAALSVHCNRLGLPAVDAATLSLPKRLPMPEGTHVLPDAQREEVEELADQLESMAKPVRSAEKALSGSLAEFAAEPELANATEESELLALGLQRLGQTSACPLCEKPWPKGELRAFLEKRARAAARATELVKSIEEHTGTLRNLVMPLLSTADRIAKQIDNGEAKNALMALGRQMKDTLASLRSFSPRTASSQWKPSAWLPDQAALGRLRRLAADLPDATLEAPNVEAFRVLTACVHIIRELRNKQRMQEEATAHNARCRALDSACTRAKEQTLGKLYATVEKQFSSHYRKLHENEDKFRAELLQTVNSLRFNVAFHGKGLHPPAALHSEGHQDSMGVCLYLALMQQLAGDALELTALDDVVMSVDADHRHQICTLLRDEFPGRQFFITTHDPIWAKQLERAGVVDGSNRCDFGGWALGVGPFQAAKALEDIEERLTRGDIPTAAALLRRWLEEELADAAETLGAAVRYRPGARNDLGELLGAVRGRFREVLDKANMAAKSWGKTAECAKIAMRNKEFNEALTALDREQWLVNQTVHFTPGHLPSANDFRPAVRASKRLLESLRCDVAGCHSVLAVTGVSGSHAVKCNCCAVSWTLEKKKGAG